MVLLKFDFVDIYFQVSVPVILFLIKVSEIFVVGQWDQNVTTINAIKSETVCENLNLSLFYLSPKQIFQSLEIFKWLRQISMWFHYRKSWSQKVAKSQKLGQISVQINIHAVVDRALGTSRPNLRHSELQMWSEER